MALYAYRNSFSIQVAVRSRPPKPKLPVDGRWMPWRTAAYTFCPGGFKKATGLEMGVGEIREMKIRFGRNIGFK